MSTPGFGASETVSTTGWTTELVADTATGRARVVAAGRSSSPTATVAGASLASVGGLRNAVPVRMSSSVMRVISTGATPLRTPSFNAAVYERSMTRPGENGPRSFTRTMTSLPLDGLRTRA